MKVIYIGTYNTNEIMSGPEKVCKRIFEEYSKTDKTMFVHYFQDGKKFGYLKKLFGYEKTVEVNGSEVLRLGIFNMLYRIISIKPEVIHILCFNRYVLFLYLLKIFIRVKIFYTLNGIIRHENKYYNKEPIFIAIKNFVVENVFIYSSDRIFYLSEFSKSILLMYYSPNNAKLSKVINGLDICFLEQGKKVLSVKEDNSVVFIGNIDQKEKGFDFLYSAIENCNIKIKLYIITSTVKFKRVTDYTNVELNFFDKMTPLSMIELFKDKKIIVSASEYDQFPIAILEAISCGLYPILTKQTGLSEFIGNYVSASVINHGDKNSLIQIISDVLSNKLQYKLFNDLKLLSWENVLKIYYLHYYE